VPEEGAIIKDRPGRGNGGGVETVAGTFSLLFLASAAASLAFHEFTAFSAAAAAELGRSVA
jgi:hypothetical protein